MSSSFSEIPKSDVYYIFQQSEGKNARDVFDWLGIYPQPLKKHIDEDKTNDVVFYIQWGYSRPFNEIEYVREVLLNYPKVSGTGTIYILAMAILDDAKRHKRECVIANWTTKGNISFAVIHCSYGGRIYDCAGNRGIKVSLFEGLKARGIVVSQANTNETIWKAGKTCTTAVACIIVAVCIGLPVYLPFIVDRIWTLINDQR